MGVKSTYTLTRSTALRVLEEAIVHATNKELAEMLESLPQSTFRNYQVCGYEEFSKEKESYPMMCINDSWSFFNIH